MATLRHTCTLLLGGLAVLAQVLPARAAAPTEQQVKAVFVFNFSHFVQWPPEALGSPDEPFVICVLGAEDIAGQLAEAAQGERVDGHPLEVRRHRSVEEVRDCRILFIGRSEAAELERVLGRLDGRGTLTVSDLEGASRRGVMIQLANERNRVRLLINVDAAQAAGLTISSNLLRPAEIVRTGQ